jgi:ketosteroid isomerase-like protein
VSQENVDIVWGVPQAWNDGGIDAVLEYLDTDVEWRAPGESMEPGVYRGHDGVRDYIGRLGEVFPERYAEPLAVVDVDAERLILVVRLVARVPHSRQEITADWAWLITVGANKKAIRVEIFTDKSGALKAVGLEE